MTPLYQQVTGPTEEPITLQEAKDHVRQDSAADDTYLTRLITVARQDVEDMANIYLVTQTVDVFFPGFPDSDVLKLTRGPLQSVTSLKYIDSAEAETAVSASTYDVDPRRGQIRLKYSALWPTATLRPTDPVIMRCVMGFGTAAAVPQKAKQAVLMLVDHFYSHRTDVILGGIALESKAMLKGVDHLLSPLKRWAF